MLSSELVSWLIMWLFISMRMCVSRKWHSRNKDGYINISVIEIEENQWCWKIPSFIHFPCQRYVLYRLWMATDLTEPSKHRLKGHNKLIFFILLDFTVILFPWMTDSWPKLSKPQWFCMLYPISPDSSVYKVVLTDMYNMNLLSSWLTLQNFWKVGLSLKDSLLLKFMHLDYDEVNKVC